VAALVSAGMVAAGSVGSAPAAASSSPAPEPVVVGNQIQDARTGQVFVPHGVNYPGFEYACEEGWGYSQGTETQANADAMVAWHINTVRIPLNENCWLGTDPTSSSVGDFGTPAGYKAAIANWVNMLNADGIVVILDLHFSAPDGHTASGQYPMADVDHSPDFWTSVASAYRHDPSVIFDAFNEPYSIWSGDTKVYDLSWDCWENGGPTCKAPIVDDSQQPVSPSVKYQIAGMQQLVTAIRAGGATQPIMLGGIDYSNNLTEWLTHEPTDPDGQLIASWHNYQGNACDTTCWNTTIAGVAAVVPVVAGETGETDGASTYLTTFLDWADTHGLGYLPWAWWNYDSLSGDAAAYALYKGDSYTPKAPEGTAYYAHLQSLPTGVPSVVNVGGGVQLGTAAPPGPRRTITIAPTRVTPDTAETPSSRSLQTAQLFGSDVSRELEVLLESAPRVTATEICR
jgi:endoglucanase